MCAYHTELGPAKSWAEQALRFYEICEGAASASARRMRQYVRDPRSHPCVSQGIKDRGLEEMVRRMGLSGGG